MRFFAKIEKRQQVYKSIRLQVDRIFNEIFKKVFLNLQDY